LKEERVGTYRTWYLALAASVAVVGPLSAQGQEEPPLKMVYAVWKSPGGAESAINHMNKKTYDLVEAFAVLVKDSSGKVEIKKRHNKAGGSARAMQAAETIDTAIARLSALPANAADSAAGYAPAGSPASRLSEKDLKRVVSMFKPGESAALLISPKPDVTQVQKYVGMGGQPGPEFVVVDIQ
jgi:hypothetical protein